MTKRIICLLTVIVAASALVPALAATKDEENVYECDMSSGKTIYFDLKSGADVRIQGWDKSKAEVAYVQRGKGQSHDVTISPEKGGLMITSEMEIQDGKSRNLDFEVRVPRKFNVRFESMGGGLKIVDLEGEFSGSTMGGSLTLRKVEGEVKLTTMGGSIEVIDADLDGSISTMGGNVHLKDVVGDLDASSMGGNVRYENVRTREGELRAPGGTMAGMDAETVTISTMGGSIEVDEAPAGAMVSTMGGNIEVDGARAFVKAMVGNLAGLEEEQMASLTRLAEAEAMWRKLVAGTPIEYLFAEDYAGLFRNPKAKDNAALRIYDEHIYPVFAAERCRVNVTGIPSDEAVAENHVKVFAQECF